MTNGHKLSQHSHLFEFSNDLYFKDITSLNIFVGNFANTNDKLYTKITQIYLNVNYKITSIELVVASANEVQQGGGSTNSCTAGLSINNQEYSYTFSSNTTSYNSHSHLFEFSNDLY